MSEALSVHTPSGLTSRLTVLTLPPQLCEHVSWLEQSFPAADHASPDCQRAARRGLEGRIEGLASVFAQAASAVRDGQAVVLRGLPAECTAMVVAVASAIGPVAQDHPDFPLVDDLEPKPGADEATRFGHRSVALTPHTDGSTRSVPPEVLVLACVHNADPVGGGESILIHVDDVAAALGSTDTELLGEPRYPTLNVPSEAGATPTLAGVLVRRADGRLTVRYFDKALEAGIASDLTAEVPSAAHLDALGRFTATVRDPAMQTRFRLDTGDMLIINNSVFLHGRTAITRNVHRHLKRLLTKLDPVA